MNFSARLGAAIERNDSLLCVGLDPNPEWLPERWRHLPLCEGLSAWLSETIDATAHLACAFKPTLGFFLALGPEGLTLLEQSLALVPAWVPVILDAKHADLNTATAFARLAFERWGVDALTLCAPAGQDNAVPFLVYPERAVFVLASTANASAKALQNTGETPPYLHLVSEARGWGTPDQLGFEVDARDPVRLARIRQAAPERLILARGIWDTGGGLVSALAAGLGAQGGGLLVPVPRRMLIDEAPDQQVQGLREEVNRLRELSIGNASACNLWVPDLCLLNPEPHADLILQLFDIGCILFGEYIQASGLALPYYVDLRKIISNPQLFHRILAAYSGILRGLKFDRIAGIPYGSLPTASGLALQLNRPLIFPRKEVKAYGTRRLIEGHFEPGETAVVVDDILITGRSAVEGAAKLQSAGLVVRDIVVLIDHGHGVSERVAEQGFQAHAVLTIEEIAGTLYQAGRLDDSQYNAFCRTEAVQVGSHQFLGDGPALERADSL